MEGASSQIWGSWLRRGNNQQWAAPLPLSPGGHRDSHPVLLSEGWPFDAGARSVVWQSDADGDEELYARRWWSCEDSVYLWETTKLTENEAVDIDPYGLFLPFGCLGSPLLVWASNIDGHFDIYGGTMSPEFRITQDAFPDRSPIISVAFPFPNPPDTSWDAWESFRDGNWDILAAGIPEQRGLVVDERPLVPGDLVLYQNYPNPFHVSTAIRYDMRTPGLVRVEIYNILGQKVRTLPEEWKAQGSHQVRWDGRDQSRRPVPTGVYSCRLWAGGAQQAIQVLYLP
ncbi:MAG: FlgD immunoglobulin-like domain containing protein [bacterium]|nr:T9SS type A sorting domain-containing protein [candidate division KSB1 bacterium]MDH7561233.1 FlgD immunoglobulin-like domain containing protein [bacterium]